MSEVALKTLKVGDEFLYKDGSLGQLVAIREGKIVTVSKFWGTCLEGPDLMVTPRLKPSKVTLSLEASVTDPALLKTLVAEALVKAGVQPEGIKQDWSVKPSKVAVGQVWNYKGTNIDVEVVACDEHNVVTKCVRAESSAGPGNAWSRKTPSDFAFAYEYLRG